MASAGTGCTNMSNNTTSDSTVSSTLTNMDSWASVNTDASQNILSNADTILTQQNTLL